MITEYYNNIMCVEAIKYLVDSKIMTRYTYAKLTVRNQIHVVRRACRNTPALVSYNSIPMTYRNALDDMFGKPAPVTPASVFERYISDDHDIRTFFASYRYGNNQFLPLDRQIEYYTNAIILKAVGVLKNKRSAMRKSLGVNANGVWEGLSLAINSLDIDKYPHSLPNYHSRLRDKYKLFQQQGPASLIHSSFGNQHARKVNDILERLILSLYCMSNKPYGSWVQEDYLMFLAGKLDIVDYKTGELIDRYDFYNEQKGCFITISEATCWNYINNPANRAVVDNLRSTPHAYNSQTRPHYHRHAPKFSLSKISLDDRDLPHKMPDGQRVKAYYAYDVASGVLLGYSYSIKKDKSLFINCIRSMFTNLNKWGYGIPMEVEVEHHLTKEFKNDLLQAGVVFPLVRWCAPGNSQEKHAEQFNRQKKYGYEKRHLDGIGRWYSLLEANRTRGDRVYDDILNKYIVAEKTYSYETIVANDIAMIEHYNNGLHRNQKLYKDKSRMQMLQENINPNLTNYDNHVVARYISKGVKTSIVRNQYLSANKQKYMLENPSVLQMLAPNNYDVIAYSMPNDDSKVYIYQNDKYICECEAIKTFNSARCETTRQDELSQQQQSVYIARFDNLVKNGKESLHATKYLKPDFASNITPETVESIIAAETASNDDNISWADIDESLKLIQQRAYSAV